MPQIEKITILFAQNEAAFNLAKNGEADIVAVPLEYGKESVDGYTMYLQDTIVELSLTVKVWNNALKYLQKLKVML